MRISWTRLGYLGFMIPFVFWGIASMIWDSSNFLAVRIAFVLSAIVVWVVGSRLNAGAEGDAAPHQAFGYPMQVSGVVVSALGFGLTLL